MFYILAVLIYVVRKSRNKEQLLDHLFEHLKEIIIKYSEEDPPPWVFLLCPNTPKIVTRVKSSIELAQLMKSLESIHDFSYIGKTEPKFEHFRTLIAPMFFYK